MESKLIHCREKGKGEMDKLKERGGEGGGGRWRG